MSIKGEFLANKANVLFHTLYERGWDVRGNLSEFTAGYHNINLFYKDGDINICFSDGREIMRMKITDVL